MFSVVLFLYSWDLTGRLIGKVMLGRLCDNKEMTAATFYEAFGL